MERAEKENDMNTRVSELMRDSSGPTLWGRAGYLGRCREIILYAYETRLREDV